MALDSTSKKANFLYSLKKYVIDNIYGIAKIPVVFDRFLPPEKDVPRWITVIPGPLDRDTLSDFSVEIYCVTRKDYEGEQLAVLIDQVTGFFTVGSGETDGVMRIPFYDVDTKVQNGSMVVTKCLEGDTLDAPDQSKFIILSINLKMASKI